MALLALTLALLAMTVATTAVEEKPLDMAPNSFDDQYQGCGPAMNKALPALNHTEFQKNSLFAQVWPSAVKMWQSRGSPVSPLSSSAQAIAIMAYTMDGLYSQFNEEVRTAGHSHKVYRDDFHFKTLHFLLTGAVQRLWDAQGQQCHCAFRGVEKYKFKAKVGDIVRFGQFASSTLCKSVSQYFGTTTVFKVQTCRGAYIKEFSKYPNEEEVLIPPFEKFMVTKVTDNGDNVQIELDYVGTSSKYNCEWLRGGDSLGPWDTHVTVVGTGPVCWMWVGRDPHNITLCHLLSPSVTLILSPWKRPQHPLPTRRTPLGHHSPGTGQRDLLSHEATKVTEVSKVTVATTITKTTRNSRKQSHQGHHGLHCHHGHLGLFGLHEVTVATTGTVAIVATTATLATMVTIITKATVTTMLTKTP
ncbi:erythroblast NAD(P)(+)--arginine ADP-ribosyltransferase-like [Cinclus cinclus]|uniref:erythroblast NAD(P)(+)--arginine ADP-ribosyltransferase-like n=1 Tax=Cinclus cinclus TaxID=127875 RepID=UPI002E163A2C